MTEAQTDKPRKPRTIFLWLVLLVVVVYVNAAAFTFMARHPKLNNLQWLANPWKTLTFQRLEDKE